MGNLANTEARIKRLENLLKDETGTGDVKQGGSVLYPVRQLTLSEEISHDDAGNAAVTVLVSWKSPAGSLMPDKIKVMLNGVTAELAGGVTEYRKGGFAAGDTVKVIVTAVYSTGSSSAVTAQLIVTGSGAAPDVPAGFSASGGFRTITLKWGAPSNPNHSHMEVWESTKNHNLESAERIAQAYGTDFVRANCGVMETRWYWIRSVDTGGNKSEYIGPISATTTAIESEEIKEGSVAESKLAPSLAGKINDSEAAVQIIEEVRTGEVNVFQQPTAPTGGMAVGDLWIDSDEVVWRYIGGQWSKQENATAYSLLKAAISQYMVKTQVASDGKLKVAGFGVFNDATTGSEFCVLADRFFVYGEAPGGGHTTVQVFSIDTTRNPPVVGINGSLIVNGTIDGSKLNVASRITLADGGELIIGENGIIQIADGTIVIDGSLGRIQCVDPTNTTTGKKVVISYGDVQFLRYNPIAEMYEEYRSIKGIASGSANSGEWVEIPGVWLEQPDILVGPKSVKSFEAASAGLDQFWHFGVKAVQEITPGSGRWRAMFACELRLGSDITVAVLANEVMATTTAGQAVKTFYSGVFTTPAGTKEIKVNGHMESEIYPPETVTATLQYKLTSSAGYVDGQSVTLSYAGVLKFTQSGYIVDVTQVVKTWLLSALNLSSGTYHVRIKYDLYFVPVPTKVYNSIELAVDNMQSETLVSGNIRNGSVYWLALSKG